MKQRIFAFMNTLVLTFSAGAFAIAAPFQQSPLKELQPTVKISGSTGIQNYGSRRMTSGPTYMTQTRLIVPAGLNPTCDPSTSEGFKVLKQITFYANIYNLFTTWTYWCFDGSSEILEIVVDPFLDAQVEDLKGVIAWADAARPYDQPVHFTRAVDIRDLVTFAVLDKNGDALFATQHPALEKYENFISFFYYPNSDLVHLDSMDYPTFMEFARKTVPESQWPEAQAALAQGSYVSARYGAQAIMEDGAWLGCSPRGGGWRSGTRTCDAHTPCSQP
jgi:hypothetical protein